MSEPRSQRPLEPRLGRVGVFSPGIMRIPHLATMLNAESLVFRPGPLRRVDSVVGWGRKPNTRAARRYAARSGVPFVALEDGFIRSVGLGVQGDPPLSIVVDDEGIYYDATSPSRLERMLAEDMGDDPAQLARARGCIDRIRAAKLSKYNDAPVRALEPSHRARVLVVDQTAGDLSVELGSCVPRAFDAMLEAALDEHPRAQILVKTHPDVASGKKRGCFADLRPNDRVRVLADAINPIALLEQVEHVYVATSLLGFEALLLGRPVTCFGVPFYAGWGVTDDRAPTPTRRNRSRSVPQLFAAAYLAYARYVDPETGTRCELERVIEHLALQRDAGQPNEGTSVCIGFSAWKRSFVPAFLRGPGARIRFARDASEAERLVEPGGRLVVWGTRESSSVRALAERRGLPVWRMEDGFLRSVGLGSDLYVPASLVVDREGIYYDPRTPSELERILSHATFSEEELARARRLRERIVDEGLSKYNLGVDAQVATRRDGRRVVLVVGQVEDDASVQLGGVDVRHNEALLRAARLARPHAYVLYKPHPDVVSGNRSDALPLKVARLLCDEVVIEGSLSDCLRVADEVHTITSLVGFEALLRGIDVHVYGQPFYSGWGLTQDRHPHPRRARRLQLDELVAGVLIRYARYVSPVTRRFTTPEAIVDHLVRERRRARGPWRKSRAARQLEKLVNLATEVLRAP